MTADPKCGVAEEVLTSFQLTNPDTTTSQINNLPGEKSAHIMLILQHLDMPPKRSRQKWIATP